MRTIASLNKEIRSLEATKPQSKDYKKNGVEAAFLRQCVAYLDSGATDEKVERALKSSELKLKAIDEGYSVWLSSGLGIGIEATKLRSKYNSEMQRSKHLRHIKVLKFILT